MQLHEIYTDNGISDLVDHLKQYGEVHNGSYSYVYAPTGKDYVYKAWTHDPGFDAYVKLIQTHKNDYFPVIHKIKELPLQLARPLALKNSKVKIAKIEKLIPYKNSGKTLCKATRKGTIIDLNLIDIITACKNGSNVFDQYEISKQDKEKFTPMVDAIVMLDSIIGTSDLLIWDAGSANIMMRPNGHIVFSDPIASSFSDNSRTLVDYSGYPKEVYGQGSEKELTTVIEVQNTYPDITIDIMKKYYDLFNKPNILATLSTKDFSTFLQASSKDNDTIYEFILSDYVTRTKNKTKFVKLFTEWYKKRFHELEQQWFSRNPKYDWKDYIYTLDDISVKMGDDAFEYIEYGRKENGYESLSELSK